MDQIRANTPAPIKANLMTEQLSVQMSWGNGGCTRAGSPGDQQSRELRPWAARRSRAMLRANAWGHDELKLCASLRSHVWIPTGVTDRKRLIWFKIDDLFSHATLQFDVWS